MRIYSGPMSMFGAKVQIAALEKGLEPEVELVPFGLRRRYDPKHPEVLRVNPKGQVPVLVDEGVEIYDSTQIFEYLEDAHPDPALWPSSSAERAKARQLEHASDEVFFPRVIRLMNPDGEGRQEALDGALHYHREMDQLLQRSSFLAGQFSYADIAFFMSAFFGEFLGAEIATQHAALVDWRVRMAARRAVRAVIEPMIGFMEGRGVVQNGFRQKFVSPGTVDPAPVS